MLVDQLIRRRNRWLKLAWIHLFETRNLRAAAMIHFTSDAEALHAAMPGITWGRHCVVANGVDLETGLNGESATLPAAAHFAGRPFIMFLGRLTWKKGLDRLIQSVAHIPGANLLIVGDDDEGYAAALETLALREGVRERMIFAGPVTGAAKRELLRRASVLVLPSYSENFGNVVLEAMAEACPVVVTPEVGAAPIVEQSRAGLVASGDPAGLADAIGRILGDAGLRSQMGRRGREAVAAGYSWDAIAGRMIEQYDALMSGGNRQRTR